MMSELSISDISITVEDGLRLSELQGRLAELQAQKDAILSKYEVVS